MGSLVIKRYALSFVYREWIAWKSDKIIHTPRNVCFAHDPDRYPSPRRARLARSRRHHARYVMVLLARAARRGLEYRGRRRRRRQRIRARFP